MRIRRKTLRVGDGDSVQRDQRRARQVDREMIDRHRTPEGRGEPRLDQRSEPVPIEQRAGDDENDEARQRNQPSTMATGERCIVGGHRHRDQHCNRRRRAYKPDRQARRSVASESTISRTRLLPAPRLPGREAVPRLRGTLERRRLVGGRREGSIFTCGWFSVRRDFRRGMMMWSKLKSAAMALGLIGFAMTPAPPATSYNLTAPLTAKDASLQ